MKTVYTVASRETIVEDEVIVEIFAIKPMGVYGSGKYPPCFKTREEALKFIPRRFKTRTKVVELEIED